jgi:hypothetical protein
MPSKSKKQKKFMKAAAKNKKFAKKAGIDPKVAKEFEREDAASVMPRRGRGGY